MASHPSHPFLNNAHAKTSAGIFILFSNSSNAAVHIDSERLDKAK